MMMTIWSMSLPLWLHPSTLNLHHDDEDDNSYDDDVKRDEDNDDDDHEPILILRSSLFQFVDIFYCLLISPQPFI